MWDYEENTSHLCLPLQSMCAEKEGCVPCKGFNTCLAVYQMCDSELNCPDGSDEMDCEEKVIMHHFL